MAELLPAVHPLAQPGPANVVGYHGGGSVATDIVKRTDELSSRRSGLEKDWRDLATYCLPAASRSMQQAGYGAKGMLDPVFQGSSTAQDSRKRFDSTAISAVERLTSGIISLVTPQSEKWHGLGVDDPLSPNASDEENQWLERVRDKQFAIRYEPRSGFMNSNDKAIKSTVVFGTGVVYVEEGFGADYKRLPCLYSFRSLSGSMLDVNAQGEHDTNHFRTGMTARQAAQRFGERLSAKVKEAANDPKRCDTVFQFIHAVCPRGEAGSRGNTNKNSLFASYWVEVDGGHLVGDGGYFEFPYAIYTWNQAEDSPYGESPAMLALDDIRGLNVARKSALTAWQQYIRPPLAVAHDGVMNRPNLNSGAINFGAVDNQGRSKIVPILTSQNPAFAKEIIEGERNNVRELLYNNLFQILVSHPEMTATEAMLRSNEKGELLGPSGAKIQNALSRMIDREFGILERKGAFEPGASLEAPQSLEGKKISVQFTSPLDRLRRQKEALGITQAYQAAGQIAAVKGSPEIFDNFDDDKAIKILAETSGAPLSIMRTSDERDEMRAVRAKKQQMMEALAMAKEGAAAAKDGAAAAVDGADATGMAAQLAGALGSGQPNTAPLPLPALAPGMGQAA